MATDAETGIVEARVVHFEQIGSTNEEALRLARAGELGPLWVHADAQVQGRGRFGRTWTSPKGNLFVSLLLHAPSEGRHLPQLSHVAGVALVAALRSCLGPAPRPRLKWPNDILFGPAKAAGILVEGTRGLDGQHCCVIGWGVNCAHHPEDLPYAATNLSAASGSSITAEAVFEALRSAFATVFVTWNRGNGYPAVRDLWLRDALPIGTPISVRAAAPLQGSFQGIDEQGRLLIRLASETRTVDAGDIAVMDQSAGISG